MKGNNICLEVLKTENEELKKEIINLKEKITELEELLEYEDLDEYDKYIPPKTMMRKFKFQ